MRVRKRHLMCNKEVHLASEMNTGLHFNSHGVVTLMGSSPIVALRTSNPCVCELNSIQTRHGYIPPLGHEHDGSAAVTSEISPPRNEVSLSMWH